jgi:hypothetical protein
MHMDVDRQCVCEGCHRLSPVEPAPHPPGLEFADADCDWNLYCPECHQRGRAVYRPYSEPSRVQILQGCLSALVIEAILLGAILGVAHVVCVWLACG